MAKVKDIIDRAKRVRGHQAAWNNHFDDLARVMIPRMLGFSMEQERGASRVDDIYDGTPMRAARGLANAVGSLMRPEGEKWFELGAAFDVDDEGQEWMEDATNKVRNAFDNPKARMRQVTAEVDLGLVVFGTAPFFLGESRELNQLLFRALPLREVAIDWDEEGLLGIYIFRKLNVRQAASIFGEKNLGEKAQQLIKDNKIDKKLTYINAVLPREDRLVDGKLARNLPIASFWIEQESEHFVEESGFHEWPYIVPRMDTTPGEDMGRSPGMIALPDSNTLQSMGETILVSGQRAADPPLFAPNDGSFSEANTFPGGISYYDASLARSLRGNPVFALDTGHSLPISREMQDDTREQIFAAFFRNVLNLPVNGPQMTATEVIERREEWIREIGPMFGRLEPEYNVPMVERAFNIMLRAGAFLPIPQSLAGQTVAFDFQSPVRHIRRQIEAQAARIWKDEVLEISAVDPSVLDVADLDEYVRFSAESAKIPLKLTRSEEEVAAKREQDAQDAQARTEMEQLGQGAGAAKDIAGALGGLVGGGDQNAA